MRTRLRAHLFAVGALLALVQLALGERPDKAKTNQLGDLVAIGGISLLEPAAPARLVDRIASPANETRSHNKLDYIIDFMRANKLTKFCDLLTGAQPEARRLARRLNALDQFTLFVPTNEALLLMKAAQLDLIQRRPDQLEQFLMAHATAQLVVPRLPTAGRSAAGETSLVRALNGAPLRVTTAALQSSGRLDMIVNGANVLGGQSHALQEPENSSATYAVVHLIDRSLFPQPNELLMDKLRQRAPKLAQYVELANDAQLNEALESERRLATLFAPSDDAFRATPSRLLEQLDSNRTFLVRFLRSHLVDGQLLYGAQLAAANGPLRPPGAAQPLEFESKQVQARTLILVNSIPIVEADLVALNGVLHLISRPLFERHLLDECRCGNQTESPASENELERDESQPPSSRVRAQRSGELVARNNRDFYRPSTAPANLIAAPPPVDRTRQSRQDSMIIAAGQPSDGQRLLDQFANKTADRPREHALLADSPIIFATPPESGLLSFDADRYKVVLNATSRQRMREQLKNSASVQAPASWAVPPSSLAQFVYDRPLTSDSPTEAATPASRRLHYAPTNSSQTQQQGGWSAAVNAAEQLAGSAASRQQRLLKFQPEDAREPALAASNSVVQSGARLSRPTTSQPAYDLISTPGPFGPTKTLAPSNNFAGCAFYDADCKRLLTSRLVRLPPPSQKSPSRLLQSAASNLTATTVTTSAGQQHLDSTFGETPADTFAGQQPSRPPASSFDRLIPSRVSPLNQPLPPWSDEDQRTGQPAVASWTERAQDDIGRIGKQQGAASFAGGLSRDSKRQQVAQPMRPALSAQILLVPVKMLQEQMYNRSHKQQLFSGSNQQFHTPTPYSVSPVTTHLPSMFSARLTNLSTAQTGVLAANDQKSLNNNNLQSALVLRQQPLRAPGAQARKQLLESGKQLRFQQAGFEGQTRGDISVTSARLRQAGGLVSQASNPLEVSSAGQPLIVRSTADQTTSADFFQNRTVAEIMDDSGLRIDGQQVTFSRLKECLAEADLLSLVTQSGNSLTIFMPTDSAFQRLVQQQVLLQQQQRPSSADERTSARVLEGPRRNSQLPLVARRGSSSPSAQADSVAGARLTESTSSLADRLTLDCASPQVRQILLDHLSAFLVSTKQLQRDIGISSLSGRKLLLSSVPSKKIVVVDGQPVIAATRAKNGMVYVVNKFLNLTQQVPNVMDLMQSQANLSTFLSYLTYSGLADRLRRETGPLTVLAPTNEAFDQLSSSTRQLINSDSAALLDVLRSHIVEGAQYGKLISMRNRLKTMNSDQTIEAQVIKPNVYLLDNQMSSMRLVGTTGNGVVNVIDRIIVPAWLRNTSSLAAGEVEALPGERVGVTANLNLPNLGSRPTQFERPGIGFTLAPSSSSTSFSFNSSGRTAGEPSNSDSPFLRLAGNASNTSKNMQLIEKLAGLVNANRFVKLLLRSRLSSSLKPDMNYVLLVPTDAAVEKLPRQVLDMLERDPDRLADLVNYHVLDTTFEYINTIPDGQTLNTLNEKDILFNWHRNNTILTASGAVVMGGIQEDNIALLVVDRVLYPTPGDILSIVSNSPILSNFTSLLRNAGLERQLSLAGPYTLFAPSDFAFNQLERRELDFLRRNRESARRFLLRHLSQPAVFTSSIALSQQANGTKVPQLSLTNSLGEELTLSQKNDYFSVNDVNFSYADVAATNGVVHVIDGLL